MGNVLVIYGVEAMFEDTSDVVVPIGTPPSSASMLQQPSTLRREAPTQDAYDEFVGLPQMVATRVIALPVRDLLSARR
jgi:hypothetical protein